MKAHYTELYFVIKFQTGEYTIFNIALVFEHYFLHRVEKQFLL